MYTTFIIFETKYDIMVQNAGLIDYYPFPSTRVPVAR